LPLGRAQLKDNMVPMQVLLPGGPTLGEPLTLRQTIALRNSLMDLSLE
jgi:hypothetical protein